MTNNSEYNFFSFLATPTPDNPEYGTVSGSYVNAWVTHAIKGDVVSILRNQIEQEHWKVERLEENHMVTRYGYSINNELTKPEKDEIFELLNSADEYGICLAFYSWEEE